MTFKKIAGLFTAAMMIANASAIVPVSAESDEEPILNDTEIEPEKWHGLLNIAVSASEYPTDFDDSDFE